MARRLGSEIELKAETVLLAKDLAFICVFAVATLNFIGSSFVLVAPRHLWK